MRLASKLTKGSDVHLYHILFMAIFLDKLLTSTVFCPVSLVK